MVIFVKHRYYFYRRFEHDIWGLCYLDLRSSKIPLNKLELQETYMALDDNKKQMKNVKNIINISYDIIKKYKDRKKKNIAWLNIQNYKNKMQAIAKDWNNLKTKLRFIKNHLNKKNTVKTKMKLYNIDKYDNIRSLKSWLLRFFYKLYARYLQRKYNRMRRYIYRIDVVTRQSRKRKFNKRFLSLRVARLYFISLKDYQFRYLYRTASKLDGNLENNYCLLLECRLMSLFYRTNFLHNIFEIMQFIKEGYVFVNYKKVTYVNDKINYKSRITCSIKTIKKLQLILRRRLLSKILLFNTPRFLFVSYRFFFAFLCRLPNKKDFVYPFALDIQRITGYN